MKEKHNCPVYRRRQCTLSCALRMPNSALESLNGKARAGQQPSVRREKTQPRSEKQANTVPQIECCLMKKHFEIILASARGASSDTLAIELQQGTRKLPS